MGDHLLIFVICFIGIPAIIFEPGKRPAKQVPVRWISWKESCRRYPQNDAPPAAKGQLGLFAGLAA